MNSMLHLVIYISNLCSNLPGFDKFNLATWKARNPNIKPTRFNVESHELGLDEKNDDDGSALF